MPSGRAVTIRKRAISPIANSSRLLLVVLSVSDVDTKVLTTLGLILVAVIVLSRTGKGVCPAPAAKVMLAVFSIDVFAAMSLLISQEKVNVAVSSPEPAAPKPPPEVSVLSRIKPVARSLEYTPLPPAKTGTVQVAASIVLSNISVTVTSKASAPPVFSKVIK